MPLPKLAALALVLLLVSCEAAPISDVKCDVSNVFLKPPSDQSPKAGVVQILAFQKGGTTSFNNLLHGRSFQRFSYGQCVRTSSILLNGVSWLQRFCNPQARTLRFFIMRDPTERAWSEWHYRRLPGVEPISLAKVRAGQTFESYIAERGNFVSRHMYSEALATRFTSICHCPAPPSLRQKHHDDLFRTMTDAEIVENGRLLMKQALDTFAVVGLMERFQETMVLLWYAWKQFSTVGNPFGSTPCMLPVSNAHNHPSPSPAEREYMRAHNAMDHELYEFTRTLFAQQLFKASENPELTHWLLLAKEHRLPTCR